MYRVNFITTEQGDDFIVSFAVAGDFPGNVLSLTRRSMSSSLILTSAASVFLGRKTRMRVNYCWG
jgi:hypothetical protein